MNIKSYTTTGAVLLAALISSSCSLSSSSGSGIEKLFSQTVSTSQSVITQSLDASQNLTSQSFTKENLISQSQRVTTQSKNLLSQSQSKLAQSSQRLSQPHRGRDLSDKLSVPPYMQPRAAMPYEVKPHDIQPMATLAPDVTRVRPLSNQPAFPTTKYQTASKFHTKKVRAHEGADRYYIIVGTYEDNLKALDQFVRLSSIGLTKATMESRVKGSRTLHMVRLGPYIYQDEIDHAKDRLRSDGLSTFTVVKN